MQTIKLKMSEGTPDTEHEEIRSNISNDETIQKLAGECREAMTKIAAENSESDFILGAIAEAEKAELEKSGQHFSDAVAFSLNERLESLELELSAIRARRFAAQVASASKNGILMALAESCHAALNEIADESVPEYFVAVGLALAAKQGDQSNEAVSAALHARLVSFTETLTEIRAYQESCFVR